MALVDQVKLTTNMSNKKVLFLSKISGIDCVDFVVAQSYVLNELEAYLSRINCVFILYAGRYRLLLTKEPPSFE